jgi:hypothetical protein
LNQRWKGQKYADEVATIVKKGSEEKNNKYTHYLST